MQGPIPDAAKITTNQLTHTAKSSLHQPNQFLATQGRDNSQFYSTSKSLHG